MFLYHLGLKMIAEPGIAVKITRQDEIKDRPKLPEIILQRGSRKSKPAAAMNKALASLDKNEIHGIVLKHTLSEPYQYTPGDFLYKYRLTIFVGGLSLLCCLLLAGYAFLQKQRNIQLLENTNAQLSTAIAQARIASQAKSQFLSRMARQ